MTSITLSRISLATVLLVVFVLALNSSVITAGNRDQELIAITDLTQVSRLAKEGPRVLMIEFSSEDCGYCRILEEEFLKPMLRNDEYNQKVVIRYISLTDNDTLVDFDGDPTNAEELASRYDVQVTPTLLFLDDKGVEVSEKLVGIWSIDFYGSFIDQRIDSGLKARM